MQASVSPEKEVIEGIIPVFESLKAAGVIVPCEDYPVHTPFFPVKKIMKHANKTL